MKRFIKNRPVVAVAIVGVASVLALLAVVHDRVWFEPTPEFDIPCYGAGNDVAYSPDGRFLAAHCCSGFHEAYACVFDTATKQELFVTQSEEFSGVAWDREGRTLVVVRPNREGIELFDAPSWKSKQKLPNPGADVFAGLSFDQFGNLYSATCDSATPEDGFPSSTDDDGVVWWTTGPDKVIASIATRIGNSAGMQSLENVFSVAACSMNEAESLIAMTYLRSAPLAVLRAKRDHRETWTITPQFTVPGFNWTWIEMAPDGELLATFNSREMAVAVYRIREDRLERVWSKQSRSRGAERPYLELVVRPIDISRDGKLVACRFDDRLEVFRVVDGKSILRIPRRDSEALCLSPDGKFLAAAQSAEKRIRVYRVPQ